MTASPLPLLQAGALEPECTPPPPLLHCVKPSAYYNLKTGKTNKQKQNKKTMGWPAGDQREPIIEFSSEGQQVEAQES